MKIPILSIVAIIGLLLAGAGAAQATGSGRLIDPQRRPWQPAAPSQQILIWPEGLAIAKPATPGDELSGRGTGRIAGRTVTMVEHVSRPTMTIYRPKARNSGAAVLVFPGGGNQVLAIDLEGTEVCDWLTDKGITCVLLKYRVPGSGPYWAVECDRRTIPATPMTLQDAPRAMSLLRQRARDLGIGPHRIGVLGASAGGHLVAEISITHDEARTRSTTPTA